MTQCKTNSDVECLIIILCPSQVSLLPLSDSSCLQFSISESTMRRFAEESISYLPRSAANFSVSIPSAQIHISFCSQSKWKSTILLPIPSFSFMTSYRIKNPRLSSVRCIFIFLQYIFLKNNIFFED